MSVYSAAARRRLCQTPAASAVTLVVAGSALAEVASTVEVPVTVVRINYSGEIALSATGLPTHVSASFSPATLTAGQTASTMTLTVGASAAAGAQSVTVTATPANLAPVTGTCSLVVSNAAGVVTVLTAQRLDGGSGSTLVSVGVPLAPTQLLVADIPNVGLFKGETEVSCYVEALGANYSGGYARALLVQTTETLGPTDTIVATLRNKGSAAVTRLTKTTPPAIPAAVWLPDSAQACSATGVFGRMVPASSWGTDLSAVTTIASEFATYYSVHSTAWTSRTQANEAAFSHLSMWAATGVAAYLRKGLQYAEDVATNYYLPNPAANDWHMMPDSMAAAYLLTGNADLRTALSRIAGDSAFRIRAGGTNITLPTVELRFRNRGMRFLLAAQRVGLTTVTFAPESTNITYTVATELQKFTDAALTIQQPSGLFSFSDSPEPAVKFFMLGEWLAALAWYAEMHAPANTVDITTAIGECLDAAWAYYTTPGFPYTTPGTPARYPAEPAAKYWDDGSSNRHDGELNMYWWYAMQWYAEAVGGSTGTTWRTRAATLATDRLNATAYRTSGKPFDQMMQWFAQGASLRTL